mmetsp:Transcript_72969/g.236034  ORF Transcript_72969/g.236034 Transcript_72969/m.236034 type:complete len:233 (-) Transcript_72969:319-1017(-)
MAEHGNFCKALPGQDSLAAASPPLRRDGRRLVGRSSHVAVRQTRSIDRCREVALRLARGGSSAPTLPERRRDGAAATRLHDVHKPGGTLAHAQHTDAGHAVVDPPASVVQAQVHDAIGALALFRDTEDLPAHERLASLLGADFGVCTNIDPVLEVAAPNRLGRLSGAAAEVVGHDGQWRHDRRQTTASAAAPAVATPRAPAAATATPAAGACTREHFGRCARGCSSSLRHEP